MSARPKIAVFVSGGGRSLENVCAEIDAGRLAATVALVVSNTSKAFALERARQRSIPSAVIDAERKLSPAEFSRAAFAEVERSGAELVVLAGFLRLLAIPDTWLGRVINIHPSLLPAFGGKGYYGHKVHEAVIASGVRFTGCTVHYVTNEYDAGPILDQRALEVADSDTPDTLAERVFVEEKLALPRAIAMHFDEHPRSVRARQRCR